MPEEWDQVFDGLRLGGGVGGGGDPYYEEERGCDAGDEGEHG